ncbi:hypothetical protein [Wolbachia endosymbiont (group E) of Neria commutata]
MSKVVKFFNEKVDEVLTIVGFIKGKRKLKYNGFLEYDEITKD